MNISKAEKLARAVLIFYSTEPWHKVEPEWRELAIGAECTTKTIADFARIVRREEEAKHSKVDEILYVLDQMLEENESVDVKLKDMKAMIEGDIT